MSLSIETFTTQYVTETATTAVIISPTLISSDVTITVTSHLSSTLTATLGQTVTIHSPPSASALSTTITDIATPASPSSPTATATVVDTTAKYTPSSATITGTATLTVTELDAYLQNTDGSIYSTWVIPYTPGPPSEPTNTQTSGLVYVVPPSNDDTWDNWSTGERAGLIVGVILAACLLFAIIWYYCRRSWAGNWWFAHGWPQSQVQPQVVQTPGPNFVQPTYVNGPLVPYAYQQGPGYGLRGGSGKKEDRRLFSGRNWFSVKQRVPSRREEEAAELGDGYAPGGEHARNVGGKQGQRKASGKELVSGG